jgi:hypothetical protein
MPALPPSRRSWRHRRIHLCRRVHLVRRLRQRTSARHLPPLRGSPDTPTRTAPAERAHGTRQDRHEAPSRSTPQPALKQRTCGHPAFPGVPPISRRPADTGRSRPDMRLVGPELEPATSRVLPRLVDQVRHLRQLFADNVTRYFDTWSLLTESDSIRSYFACKSHVCLARRTVSRRLGVLPRHRYLRARGGICLGMPCLRYPQLPFPVPQRDSVTARLVTMASPSIWCAHATGVGTWSVSHTEWVGIPRVGWGPE